MSDSDLQRRARDIRAVVGEHVDGPLEEAFVAIICAGCGKTERADTAEDLEPILERDGWAVSATPELPDLCPRCVTAMNAIYERGQAREAVGRLKTTIRGLFKPPA